MNGKPASWWERQREKEEEEKQARKRAEKAARRKRGVEELVGEVMRITRVLEKKERKRKEVWKGKDWDRRGGQSKM